MDANLERDFEALASVIPIVIEKTGQGERSWDIYSRLLKERIIFLGNEVSDYTANIVIARVALALGAGGQQDRAHRRGLAEAVGGDVAAHELHGVVDREARGDRAARAVDVDRDVLALVLELQVEELGDHDVRRVVAGATPCPTRGS